MNSHPAIRVHGARQHNLKNISVEIPRDALTVVTGLSGSGKSSLAFDTVYAEGERRYVESLSAYARQFLEQMPKPDVDLIEGLSPTIAIQQHAATTSPRSTVATTTEVYDYLRILFAQVGRPHCWECGKPVDKQTVAQMVDAVIAHPVGTRAIIVAPLHCPPGDDPEALLDDVAGQGYVRVRIDGEVYLIEDAPELPDDEANLIDVVVDRIVLKDQVARRTADSLELALRLSNGRAGATLTLPDQRTKELAFSEDYTCPDHLHVRTPELTPRMFSFNSPYGACSACSGLGTVLDFDADLIVPNKDLSLAAGAISAWRLSGKRMNAVYAAMIDSFCRQFDVSPDIPFRNIPEALVRILLHGTNDGSASAKPPTFEGVLPNLKRRWTTTDSESVKHRLHQYQSEAPCESCHGARLRRESLAVMIGNANIADVCDQCIGDAKRFFDDLSFEGEARLIAEQPLREVRNRIGFLHDVGLDYLALSRSSATLSGGEAQRIRLATQIGSGLVGMCYCLDEPTIGLHQRDSRQLVSTLTRLAADGNAVLVVEHDEEVIDAADHIIDIGPGAGARGGELIFQGSREKLARCKESVTAQYLSGRLAVPVPAARRPYVRSNAIEIRGAVENNLKNLTVRFPLGCFVCVTGVSGSGKSTLATRILLRALNRRINGTGPKPGEHDRIIGASRVDKVIQIDQSPIGRTPRSNPATYVGVFDQVRKLYAGTRESKIRGYGAGRFSFNVKGGRCEDCQGQGTRRIEMHFLPDVFVECATCGGTRYNRETLEVRYRGKNIADVLDMRVQEAVVFFQNFSKVKRLLRALIDVGLGYVNLGQASTTLSGGEAQRVKLAAELGKSAVGHTLYILDEPTTGLHFADIHKLLKVLNRLADMGHTIIVIEHNLDVIKVADWVIDLGPEGGDGGGMVVAEGTPEEIAANPKSYTGQYLKPKLATGSVVKAGRTKPKRPRSSETA